MGQVYKFMMANIQTWYGAYKREIIVLTLFFLASTISFALGYIMASDQNHAAIIIEKAGAAK